MTYEINFDSRIKEKMKKLDRRLQIKIISKIEQLKTNPFIGKSLTGKFKGKFRLRIDKYRVIYTVRNNILLVLILDVGHRKNIYK